MRSWLAVLALVLLAGVPLADDAPPPVQPHGEMVVPEPSHDAGKVERGATIKHSFLVKNVGSAQLSVDAKPG